VKFGRKSKKIDPSRLHPVMAAGLTEGKHSLEEAAELPDPADKRDSVALLKEAAEVTHVEGTRVPTPRFVVEDSLDSVWHLGDDRLQRNSVQTMSKEVVDAIRTGHMCLRCYEPQPVAFPVVCDFCEYPMHDRQVMDFAMEFEGDRHLGPAKPITEYMEEKEELIRQITALEQRKTGKKMSVPRSI
jgi:hypothetical protein